jgi:peptide/nickel transport system substrate-binding protein
MVQALIAETMAEAHCGIDEYGVAEITMQEDGKVKSKTLPVTLSGMIMIVLAVACGGAPAAPDPTAAPAAEPTAVRDSGETSQPTAAPQVADPPTEVEVNPGKVTIMVGDLANERFDYIHEGGGPGAHGYGRLLHAFLISTNERTEFIPGVATHWGISDDGLTWTFTIREGVTFHDGSELTPDDALWGLEHAIGPRAFEYITVATTAINYSRKVDRIELSGPNEVSVITKEIVTELPVLVGEARGLYSLLMPKRTELYNAEMETAYDNSPIGAGPMRLANHVKAQVMTFERFDDYYYQPDNGFPEDKRPNFQSLDMYLVPEEATRIAALRSGEADIVPASLASKEQVEAGGGRLVFGQEGSYVNVMLHGCWQPQNPCSNKGVRQALDYAINKELMRDTLFGGPEVFQTKGWGPVTPSTIGYTPELDPIYDPDKARQLLADAGYPGGEGFGKLIVNTEPSSAMPFQVESAQLAADMWRRELGLDVEVRVSDRTGNKERERVGEMSGQVYWRDNEARIDASSSVSGNYADLEAADRLADDPELLRLVQETFNILDAGERAEASKKLYQRLREESYELSVGYANIPWGVGPRILTWKPYPLAPFVTALHTLTLK